MPHSAIVSLFKIPFPVALLDASVAYTLLIYRPYLLSLTRYQRHHCLHKISADAILAPCHLQSIVFAPETSSSVPFYGAKISLPYQAGISMLSAGLESTFATPSLQNNAKIDSFSVSWSMLAPDYPASNMGPLQPPHGHQCCLDHHA